MPVVKKRNQQTETRLLLESNDPVELPPAEIEDRSVLVQFEKFKPYISGVVGNSAGGNDRRACSGDDRRLDVRDPRADANVLGEALARRGHAR